MQISVTGASAAERTSSGDPGYVHFTVSLDRPATEAVQVAYRLVEATALVNEDIYFSTGLRLLTFAVGETSKTLSVRIDGDNVRETDEAFMLELFNPTGGATFAGGTQTLRATGWVLDDDGEGLKTALFASSPILVEGQDGTRSAVFDVSLSRPQESEVVVDYATADISARAGVDYVATSGRLSFAPGVTVQQVTVPVIGDTLAEPSARFALTLSSTTAFAAITPGEALILDDDGSDLPVATLIGGFAGEGTTTGDPNYIVYSIILSKPSTESVTISYRLVSGTAQIDDDAYFPGSARSVTFGPGETVQTVSVRVDADNVSEPDEAIVLEIYNPRGAALENGAVASRATGWILDDDNPGNRLALFASSPEVVEGDDGTRVVLFDVSLSRPSLAPLSVAYRTVDGSALAGSDYEAASGTLVFAPGQTRASVAVTLIGDDAIEPSEYFSLVLDGGPAFATVAGGRATILDDDAGGALPTISLHGSSATEGTSTGDPYYLDFAVRLSQAAATPVTMSYRLVSASGTAHEDVYFPSSARTVTFAPGETVKIVSVRIDADNRPEFDEAVMLELFNASGGVFAGGAITLSASGWIQDDDSTGARLALVSSSPVIVEGADGTTTVALFEISLSRPAPTELRVSYRTVDGSARAGEDYEATSGTLVFAPGQSVAAVAVPVTGDALSEGSETFSLLFGETPGIAATHAGVATILDDDASALPTLSIARAAAPEGTSTGDPYYLAFTLTLSAPAAANVGASYRLVSATGWAGLDAYFPSGARTVTFAPGETSKTVEIRVDADNQPEFDEAVILELFNPDGAAFPGGAPTAAAVGWILDDDMPSVRPSLLVTSPTIVEGDAGARLAAFELSLSRPAPAEMSVDYRTIDGSARAGEDYEATSGSIVFGKGQTTATVFVTVHGDALFEGAETFTLAVTVPAGIATANAGIATILDDDAPGGLPSLSLAGATTIEGTSTGDPYYLDFVMRLSAPSSEAVTVEYRLVSGTAQVDDDAYFPGSARSVTFAPGQTLQTVSVRVDGDNRAEPDEVVVLEAFAVRGAVLAGGVPVLRAAGWILDDDSGTANTLAVAASSPLLVEGAAGTTMAAFEISLSRPAASDIDIAYRTLDGSAIAGEDYEARSGVLRFAAGQTTATVFVPVLGDTAIERGEQFSLILSTPAAAAISNGIATILDDDAGAATGVPTINLSGADAQEGTTGGDPYYLVFTATLSAPSAQTITVSYRLANEAGDATADDAYFPSSARSVSFAPGETSKAILVRVNADSLVESDERVQLELYAPTNAAFAGGTQTLRASAFIRDDDGPRVPAISVSNVQVLEGDTGTRMAQFEITLSQPAVVDMELTYATIDGTAKAGSDYEAVSGTLTILAGQRIATVGVPVFGDITIEPTERFSLAVSTATTTALGIGEIVNDEVQSAAVGTPDVYGVLRGETLVVDAAGGVLANDSDRENHPLTAQLVTGPQNGTLELNADGSFIYVPRNASVSTDSFVYRPFDGIDTSADTLVRINLATAADGQFTGTLTTGDRALPGVAQTGSFVYTNGNALAVAGGIAIISGDRAVVSDASGARIGSSLAVLALGDGEGAVDPGESGRIDFSYKVAAAPGARSSISVSFADRTDTIDWASLEAAFRPVNIDVSTWSRIFSIFTEEVGGTVGTLADALVADGRALAAAGIDGTNADLALAFELAQAGDFGSIAERAHAGSLGAGWAFLGDLGLEIGADGSVALKGSTDFASLSALSVSNAAYYTVSASVGQTVLFDGVVASGAFAPRGVFTPRSDGGYAATAAGTLERTAAGYELTGADGTLLRFDATGRFLSSTLAGATTTATHDEHGRIVQLTGDDGSYLNISRDGTGKVSLLADSGGDGVLLGYLENGMLGSTAGGARSGGTFAYDGAARDMVSAATQGVAATSFAYDADYRLAELSRGDGVETLSFAYDAVGGFTATDKAGRSVDVALLPDGTAWRISDASGTVSHLYDATGRLTGIEGPDGSVVGIGTDDFGRVTAITMPDGGVMRYGYDADGLLPSSFTDSGGATRTFVRDADGRIVQAIWADGSSLDFTYDEHGDLVHATNRREQVTESQYDSGGRLVSQSAGTGGAATYQYDARGQLASVTTAEGTTQVTRDGAGLIVRIDFANGRSLSYAYDDAQRRTAMIDQDGVTQTYGYDAIGRLATIGDDQGVLVSYGYNASGGLAREVNRNGTSTNYGYDDAGRLTAIVNLAADESVLSLVAYGYDAAGNRTSMQTLDGIWTYGYDALGQLVSADFASAVAGLADKHLAYSYDAAGNRTSMTEDGVVTSYAYNALNQLVSAGDALYAYDADGNLVTKTVGEAVTRYSYDVDNRLVAISGPEGETGFEYDVFGNRTAVIVNGQRTGYLVDPLGGDNAVREYGADGALAASYAYGLGLASRIGADGGAFFYDFDGVGSVIGITDATGALVNRYAYTPFGDELIEQEGIANAFEFNGALGVMEDQDDLLYMRARSYDVASGRFISEDPLWLTGDVNNLYRFVGNSPVALVDPSGFSGYDMFRGMAGPGPYFVPQNGEQYQQYLRDQQRAQAYQQRQDGIREGIIDTVVGAVKIGSPVAQLALVIPLAVAAGPAALGAVGIAAVAVIGTTAAIRIYDGVKTFGSGIEQLWDSLSSENPYSRKTVSTTGTESGGSDGDPHLRTFDGLGYDFQAVGEFTLVRGEEMEIQVRQSPWGTRKDVSVNVAVAVRVGDHSIAIYADGNPLVVNGHDVAIADRQTLAIGDGTVARDGNVYVVTDGQGNGVRVQIVSSSADRWLQLRPFIKDGLPVTGLLGNNNGDRTDDIATRDGEIFTGRVSARDLYVTFADSWRVTDETSLFRYGLGESTATYTDLDFPQKFVRLSDLDPDLVAWAQQVAQAAGLVPGTIEYDDTVFDIAITGAEAFAQAAVVTPKPPEDQPTAALEVQRPPVVEPEAVTIAEDTSVIVDVLANDSDPEGDPLALVSVGTVSGSAEIVDGKVRFTPAADFNGIAIVDYVVGDPAGNRANGQLTVTVTPVNDAPIAVADSLTVRAGESATLDVLANDVDVDEGDHLTLLSATLVEGAGSVEIVDGRVVYAATGTFATLREGQTGSATISYVVRDDAGLTATAQVAVTVNGVGVERSGGAGDDWLYGTADPDLLSGGEGDDRLFGLAGDDILLGGPGNDVLDGGPGADFMAGNEGDDFYVVDDAGDVVEEAPDAGYDTVHAMLPSWTLGPNVEALIAGIDTGVTLTGNALDNSITGGAGADVIDGGAGDDLLTGGLGADLLIGGAGLDLFFGTAADFDGDTIADLEVGESIVFVDVDPAQFGFSFADGILSYSGGSLRLPGIPETARLQARAGNGTVTLDLVDAGGAAGPARSDFNGDGRSDILWRNMADGTVSNWLGQETGGFVGNDANALVTGVPLAWQVAGIGDFDGDGRADLLWRNVVDGTFSNWLGTPSGGFASNDAHALVSGVPLDWRIEGVGDFDGDGRDDILWRHAESGLLSNWLARADGGFTPNDGNSLTSVPTIWQVAGTGDFDGDGRDDLLWRNLDGAVSNWLSTAQGGFTPNDGAAMAQVGTDWAIIGTGDFDGDGRDDILWRHADGTLANWLARADGGFTPNDGNFFVLVPNEWQVVAIADYNGDGKDDLLWRHEATGALSNWLAQENGALSPNDAHAFALVNPSWQAGLHDFYAT